jgi:hypothetical protein
MSNLIFWDSILLTFFFLARTSLKPLSSHLYLQIAGDDLLLGYVLTMFRVMFCRYKLQPLQLLTLCPENTLLILPENLYCTEVCAIWKCREVHVLWSKPLTSGKLGINSSLYVLHNEIIQLLRGWCYHWDWAISHTQQAVSSKMQPHVSLPHSFAPHLCFLWLCNLIQARIISYSQSDRFVTSGIP